MDSLLGNRTFRFKDFLGVSDNWQTSICSGVNISVQEEWAITNPVKIENVETRYSGGTNGRIIARYNRCFDENLNHYITLHDHQFNTIRECVVKERCRNVFFHVTSTDELIAVTSSGRLFLYQGETVISSIPILSPELEPNTNQNENESTHKQKRNREIVDVAFWDNGFVYIDKDGYIVEYVIDPSNIQASNEEMYKSNEEPYIYNVEPINNSHTKVISHGLKGIKIITCFDIIPPEYTGLSSGSPYVFVCNNNVLYILSEDDSCSIEFPADIIRFSFSASFRHISIVICPMILLIMPVTLDTLHLKLEIDEGDTFCDISWAGDDAPILCFQDMCLLVLSTGETIKIPTKSLIFKQSDSALLLSAKALYRVSIVSDSLGRCFGVSARPNEETKAFRLIRAFCTGSHAQVLKMRENGELKEAVKDIVDSVQQVECSISPPSGVSKNLSDLQTTLMTAACFGRSYMFTSIGGENENNNNNNDTTFSEGSELTEEFVKATMWIRLANMFKRDLGICVSPACLRNNTTANDCVARLCGRGLFSPAMEVADEFGGDKRSIVTRWCCRIVDQIGNDDQLCYQILIHMKKSLSNNIVKSRTQGGPPIFMTAINKMIKSNDDFGAPDDDESLNHDRFSCPLFDTAAIASGCLIRGHPKLANNIAKNELNSSLVIPFFAASGLWKEALIAAANSFNANTFCEVLNRAVLVASNEVIISAIESSYFVFSAVSKIVLAHALQAIVERAEEGANREELISQRRRTRSRGVSSADAELCKSMSTKQATSVALENILENVKLSVKTLHLCVASKLRILNAKVAAYSQFPNPVATADSFKLVREMSDKLKAINESTPTSWLSNQVESMAVEVKLFDIYKKFIDLLNSDEEKPKITDPIPPSKLSVSSLINYAVDINHLPMLLGIIRRVNFEDFNPKRAVMLAANYLARNDRFEDFVNLMSRPEAPFSSVYKTATATALYYFGLNKTREFVNNIQPKDEKERQAIVHMVDLAVPLGKDSLQYVFNSDVYNSNSLSIDLFK